MSVRAEKAAVALRMRAEGKLIREIAAELGVSMSYASGLCVDPTGDLDRERKRRYSGTCIDCGRATCGNDGRALAPERCQPCRTAYEIATKTWTPDAIILAIQEWTRKRGCPPQAHDWLHTDPRGRHPCFGSVYKSASNPHSPFQTWNDAIRAAGFQPFDRGRYPRAGEAGLRDTTRRALAALRQANKPLTMREIKAASGCATGSEWPLMQSLVRRGLAVRVGWGRYAAAEYVAEQVAA